MDLSVSRPLILRHNAHPKPKKLYGNHVQSKDTFSIRFAALVGPFAKDDPHKIATMLNSYDEKQFGDFVVHFADLTPDEMLNI